MVDYPRWLIQPQSSPLGELALLFFRLGATAFGGPAAHIAMMEDEVSRQPNWLSRQDFPDYLGATNLIPGPNSIGAIGQTRTLGQSVATSFLHVFDATMTNEVRECAWVTQTGRSIVPGRC